MILCNVGDVIIFEHGRYIPASEPTRMLILSSCVLLAFINTIYKLWSRLGNLVRFILSFHFWAQELYICGLKRAWKE